MARVCGGKVGEVIERLQTELKGSDWEVKEASADNHSTTMRTSLKIKRWHPSCDVIELMIMNYSSSR